MGNRKIRLWVISAAACFAFVLSACCGAGKSAKASAGESAIGKSEVVYDIPAEKLIVRDPFVFADKKSGKYYIHANGSKLTDEQIRKFGHGRNALYAFESADLKNWRLVGASFVPTPDFWGKSDFWAPDMFFIDGKYFIIATFSAQNPSIKNIYGETVPMRGSSVLVSDKPDRDFKPLVNAPITPKDYMALDATVFEDADGTFWLLYCREWVQIADGQMIAQKISRDLKKTLSAPIVLFKASDANWIKEKRDTYVTDAPVVNRLADGSLYMTWSSFASGKYRIGVARSPSGKIDGKWIHDDKPLNEDDGGHAMVFKSFDGKTKISYHAPNSKTETLTIRDFKYENGKFVISDK